MKVEDALRLLNDVHYVFGRVSLTRDDVTTFQLIKKDVKMKLQKLEVGTEINVFISASGDMYLN